MKISELREMSDEQLELSAKEAANQLFRLRVQSQTEKLDTPSEMRRNRRLTNLPYFGCLTRRLLSTRRVLAALSLVTTPTTTLADMLAYRSLE